LGGVPDDRGDAAPPILTATERRLVELLADALILELRGEVCLLEEDTGVRSADDEEDET
jgi:hypothetical protein